MELQLGRLTHSDGSHGSSSTCLDHEDDMMRIQLGQESVFPDKQRLLSIELKHPYYANIYLGEKATEFACVYDEIKAENYQFVKNYAIGLITTQLLEPEKMTVFVNRLSEDAYDKGWKNGRNKLRRNLDELLFREE